MTSVHDTEIGLCSHTWTDSETEIEWCTIFDPDDVTARHLHSSVFVDVAERR